MKKISNPYVLTALACIGGFLFGFDIASMSAILSTTNYKVYFGNTPVTMLPDGSLTSEGPTSSLQGGITASMAGGSFVSSIISGWLSDGIGRRNSIFVACALWILGSVLSCAAQNVAMLIVGRFICGMCVGIASAQVPVYISELAPAKIRGRLVGCQQWAITWGICIFFYISYGCSFIGEQDGRSTASFRVPWGLQMIPAAFIMCMVPFMPRSPRWLARKGKWEEALDVLALIHAKGDKSNALVLAELKEIELSIASEGSGSFSDLFKGNQLNRLHIAVFTQIWSQLCGMNANMYYIGYVFEMAGFTGNVALVSSSIQYVINVLMTVPALIWLDKWGRRRTLMAGSSLMALWMILLSAVLATRGHANNPAEHGQASAITWVVNDKATGKAVIAFTYLFVASYAPTVGPVSWAYPPELFGNALRGKAVSVATSQNWLFNFALGYFVPPAFENIQWRTYLVFAVFCVVMTIHFFLAFPETKGVTLEEIDEIFEANVPAWRSAGLVQANKLEKIAQAIQDGEKPEVAVATVDHQGRAGATASVETPPEDKDIKLGA